MDKKQDIDLFNMVEEYRKELLEFYAPYFSGDKELRDFVNIAFNYDEEYSQIRFMIQQVQRFVALANDIDKIRPARDPLRIFFLKTCLESLCNISGYKNKKQFFYDFEECFSEDGKDYILSNIVFKGIDLPEKWSPLEMAKYGDYLNKDFSIRNLLNIIKVVRDMVVHDGNYWSMQFFVCDNSTWITEIITDEDILEMGKNYKKEKLTYCFNTKLNYKEFIFYFVQACVNFIAKKREATKLYSKQLKINYIIFA